MLCKRRGGLTVPVTVSVTVPGLLGAFVRYAWCCSSTDRCNDGSVFLQHFLFCFGQRKSQQRVGFGGIEDCETPACISTTRFPMLRLCRFLCESIDNESRTGRVPIVLGNINFSVLPTSNGMLKTCIFRSGSAHGNDPTPTFVPLRSYNVMGNSLSSLGFTIVAAWCVTS